MAKQEQVLIIEPANELTFVGPFTSPVSSVMILRNPTERKICFKIKTTAPKRYCVKPNSGVIDPKQHVQVAVSLQPFDYDPNDKNRHKFMVQSMFAPDGEINQDTLWKETAGNQLMDSKLRCVFVLDNQDSGNFDGNEYSTAKTELPAKASTLSSSPKVGGIGPDDSNLRKSVEEIKKLQEEISALRQENIQLKEEALRQKRLAAAASNRQDLSSSSHALSSGESINVATISPDQNALSVAYLYAALAILVMGIIVGKWFL